MTGREWLGTKKCARLLGEVIQAKMQEPNSLPEGGTLSKSEKKKRITGRTSDVRLFLQGKLGSIDQKGSPKRLHLEMRPVTRKSAEQ